MNGDGSGAGSDDGDGSGEEAAGSGGEAVDASPPLWTDLTPVIDAVRTAEAVGFVAVGDRFDDALRYLTRFSGPDRAYGLVVCPGEGAVPPRATLLAPGLFAEQAEREFVAAARRDDLAGSASGADAFHDGVVRTVRVDRVGDPVGLRAVAVLDRATGRDGGGAASDDADADDADADDADADDTDADDADADTGIEGDASDELGSVLVPASIPHDTAVYLERAGYELASTTAVAEARAVKSPAEIDRIRRVQRAAAAGMARAESVLATSDPVEAGSVASDDGSTGDDTRPLLWRDEPLTTERLRRAVNATLAAYGVRDAGNTVIGSGPTAADLHYVGTDSIDAGETVLIDISPRGPDGYYGDLTRTFVVDGDGGWDRRAYVAVEAAREAALAELGPGVTAASVHREAAAELAAYGFDPDASEGESGFTHGTGHGVGVSLHESPSLSSDVELRPGHVVTVEPGVYDPAVGGVRLEDLVVVTDDGYERLASYPFGTVPTERDRS